MEQKTGIDWTPGQNKLFMEEKKMMTDTELKIKGFNTLVDTLGEVDAERFITLILREPFDYTKWQKNLWENRSIEEISGAAMQQRKKVK